MLSIGKVNGADGRTGRYYTDAVASGAEDYYAGQGEAQGRWVGSAVGRFELDGAVDAEAFQRMLNGLDPASGRVARDRSTIAAWQREATEHQQALTSLPSPGNRDSWIAEHGPAVRELATIEHELHRRDSSELRATIALALTNPDPDIHAHLGERPQQPEQARAWETAVRALVAYRHHTGGLDLSEPSPDVPDLWRDARHAVDHHERGREHPEPDLGP